MRGNKGFGKFLSARRSALARISRATHGESSVDDVIGEAYVLGAHLAAVTGRELDFADTHFQEELLARLYQRLVRYAEKNVRYAVRLDHAPISRDGDDRQRLIGRLVAPGADPLANLVGAEEAADSERAVNPHESTASAYVVLLRAFGNRMASVARYLSFRNRMRIGGWLGPDSSDRISTALQRLWRKHSFPALGDDSAGTGFRSSWNSTLAKS